MDKQISGQMSLFDYVDPEPSQMPMKEYLTKMGYKNEYFERPDHECIVEVVDIHEYPKLHLYEAKYVFSFGNIVQEYNPKCGYSCHWWKEIRPITPEEKKEEPVAPDQEHEWWTAVETLTMFGEEWYPLSEKPEGITQYDDLRILGPYKSVYGERWSDCPAKLHEGEIVAYDVPWDIPRPHWKYWRLKEKVYPLDIRGICDDPYCPQCGYLFETTRSCKRYEVDCERCPECHIRVDWTTWHRLNDEEDEG